MWTNQSELIHFKVHGGKNVCEANRPSKRAQSKNMPEHYSYLVKGKINA